MDKSGLEQQEIARKSGISKQQISNLKSGQRRPNPDCLIHLFDILGVPAQDRQRLNDMAAIAHLPAESQERFIAILSRLDAQNLEIQRRILESHALKAESDALKLRVTELERGL